ncbi:pyridoxal 5'-phosphate synthase glutaminase subunit PdxT [Chloroflexota bacterium]
MAGKLTIGVLAQQGAFAEHIRILTKLGAKSVAVRQKPELTGLDGLIIPGGESTSISKLLFDYGLSHEIKTMSDGGLPVLGTCAGLILMAKEVPGNKVKPLGIMDILVKRNAFGRQIDSFEALLDIPVLGPKPFPGVFIRAPRIENVTSPAEVLAALPDGQSVMVRQGKNLVASFHPELTKDTRFHRYFLDIINGLA